MHDARSGGKRLIAFPLRGLLSDPVALMTLNFSSHTFFLNPFSPPILPPHQSGSAAEIPTNSVHVRTPTQCLLRIFVPSVPSIIQLVKLSELFTKLSANTFHSRIPGRTRAVRSRCIIQRVMPFRADLRGSSLFPPSPFLHSRGSRRYLATRKPVEKIALSHTPRRANAPFGTPLNFRTCNRQQSSQCDTDYFEQKQISLCTDAWKPNFPFTEIL